MTGHFVHDRALVESADIGSGTRVWAWAHVMSGARVGEGCNIGEHCFIEEGVVVGDRVTIKNGVAVWQGVTIEDDAFVGPNAVFTNDLRPRSKVYHDEVPKTVLRSGSSIGANATILAGTVIGRHALVGAGAVVTGSVPDFGLVFGNPARLRGFVCRCAQELVFHDDQAVCECGARFTRNGILVSEHVGTDHRG